MQTYTYDKTDGALNSMTPGDGRTLSMSYDSLRRLSSVTGGVYNRTYSYRDIGTDKTTTQVSRYQYKNTAGTAITFDYTYDVLGNIASYKENNTTYFYIYDDLNQLTEVKDEDGEVLYEYEYDYAGNILSANGKSYTYGNTVWKDLLTKYDEQSIAYEGQTISGNTVTGTVKSGNPISYYNGTRWEFDWEEGRNLVSADSNVYSIDYTYDLNGLRTSKKVGNVTHNYYYASGKLLRETYGSNTLDFFYDQSGYPYALKYNGTLYYYITNLQGDVLHLTNTSGTVVVSYTYDPYGKPLDTTGTMATTLGAANPLRYRGYYYDTETGFYYLQSRYYDPSICRFLDADGYVSTGQGVRGYNMFAYCRNNPTSRIDKSGTADDYAGSVGEAIAEWLYELITGSEHPNKTTDRVNEEIAMEQVEAAGEIITYVYENTVEHQQNTDAVNTQVIAEQNEMIGDCASWLWDAYMRGYNLQQEAILLQANANIDMFDSHEDIERSIDIIDATVGFSVATYEVAMIVMAGNPPAGAVTWAVLGVIWAGRGIYRACQ